jgi:hypothetical protein
LRAGAVDPPKINRPSSFLFSGGSKMEFYDNDHVYKVIPDVMGNKESDKPAVFHLKGISQEAFSEAVRAEKIISQSHTKEKATDLIAANTTKMISDRVVKIENLICSGKPIETYDDLTKYAPRSLVNWIVAAVHSTEMLMESEIKN